MISPEDFDITQGIVARTNNKIMLFCTVDMTVKINDKKRTCKPESHILITNTTDFKIETEDGKYIIEAHTLTQEWEQTTNVFYSETDLENDNDIIQIPAEDLIVVYVHVCFQISEHKHSVCCT